MESRRDGEPGGPHASRQAAVARRLASRRVADALRSEIESGTYPAGSALPPLRQIAEQHGVAVNTAMAAVRLLGDEGYVMNKPNAGSYVRDWTSAAEPDQELRRLRGDVGALRTQVQDFEATLAAIEARLSSLAELIARADDRTERPET